MQVRLGAVVFGHDRRKSSAADRVLIDPRNWEVTHVVIRTGTRRQPALKLVPVSLVERWEPEGVILRLTSEELQRMPDYYIERPYVVPRGLLASATLPPRPAHLPVPLIFTQPGFPYGPGLIPHWTTPMDRHVTGPVPWHEPVSGMIEIKGGAIAEAVDGEVGRIERLLLDTYTDRVNAFVISAGGAFKRDVAVPLEWVAYVSPERVRFAATRDQLERIVDVPAGNYLAVVSGRVKVRRVA